MRDVPTTLRKVFVFDENPASDWVLMDEARAQEDKSPILWLSSHSNALRGF